MKKGIRIYIEGGGDSERNSRPLRLGFQKFLSELNSSARSGGLKWNVILCGGRQSAYDDFCAGIKRYPESFNILLVDSEAPIATKQNPWEHLKNRKGDGWENPIGCTADNCHLMVQTVEAWLIADPDALAQYYGQKFHGKALPGYQNVEQIPKNDLLPALQNASRDSQKRMYSKIKHCADLLARIDVSKVRERAAYCDRLFRTVEGFINNPT